MIDEQFKSEVQTDEKENMQSENTTRNGCEKNPEFLSNKSFKYWANDLRWSITFKLNAYILENILGKERQIYHYRLITHMSGVEKDIILELFLTNQNVFNA